MEKQIDKAKHRIVNPGKSKTLKFTHSKNQKIVLNEEFIEKTRKTLSTLRYWTFAIEAHFEKVNGKLDLKIAFNKKKRVWFSGLCNYTSLFDFSFKLPNA